MTVHAQALNGKRPPIRAPSFYSIVRADLDRVDAIVDEVKLVDSPKLREMLDHVLAPRGKRLRSTVALLAGRFGDYRPRILALLAASIELLHTVTLLHDDVIDSAETRRGTLTANARYHNAAAVVLGDYIFVAAADIIGSATKLDRGNIEILRLFARTGKTIAIGELAQDTRAEVSDGDVGEYFDRIGRKTATLFAASAEAGAMVARAAGKQKAALRDYGQHLGMVFQIVDDILDFSGDEHEMGKPIASDLADGVLTLPALLFMERKRTDNPVRQYLRNGRSDDGLARAILAIRQSDVLDESYDVARGFRDKAVSALAPLPGIAARTALADLANYALDRRA
jgi:geranylgeranyl pyrophosphate synthase